MPQKPPPRKSVEQQVAEAIPRVRRERPAEAGASIQPMGWFGRLLKPSPTDQAFTNPFTGSVYYAPERMSGLSDEEVADTIFHELEHTSQVRGRTPIGRLKSALGLGEASAPYAARPDEIAAWNAEVRRAASQGRTKMRPQWNTGLYVDQGDIPLRRQGLLAGMKK